MEGSSQSDTRVYESARNMDETSQSDGKVYKPASNLIPLPSSNAIANVIPEPRPVIEVPGTSRTEPVKFDPDDEYYNMTGEKIMLIFNHYTFEENSIYGDEPPEDREGSKEDADALEKLFKDLGFNVTVHEDEKYDIVKEIITKLCTADHSGTSCLAIVIMTHGHKGGLLCAHDRPYFLADIVGIFEKGHISLANKPKLFFIQATEVVSSVHPLFVKALNVERQESGEEACRGEFVDSGKMTYHDGYGKKSLHVPTHVDFLIARSTVENYRAWREYCGAWFIKVLCEVIRDRHQSMDLLQMLTLVTKKVAYSYKTNTLPKFPQFHEKKATPETTFTLTKLLKF